MEQSVVFPSHTSGRVAVASYLAAQNDPFVFEATELVIFLDSMSKCNGKGTSCTHDIETGSHVNPFANTRAKLPVTKAVEVGR